MKTKYNNKPEKLTIGIFILYFFVLIWIILFKMQLSFENLSHIRNINLIPFAGSAIVNGKILYSEIINNILIFLPFGVLICLLKQESSFISKVIPIFLTSLALESLQFIFAIGASDITDLIDNTLGGIIGICIFYIFAKIFKDKVYKVMNIISLVAAIIITLLIAVLLFSNI